MEQKSILIIFPAFAPAAIVGAKRPTKLAIALRKRGWKVYVITTDEKCSGDVDKAFDLKQLDGITVIRTKCRSIWNHSQYWQNAPKGLPRLWAKFIRAIAKLTEPFVPVDFSFPWSYLTFLQALKLVKDEQINLLWTTIPYWSGADLTHKIWKKTKIPYILDFRDVRRKCPDNQVPRDIRKAVKIEQKAVENAAGITYVAPKQIDTLTNLYKKAANIPSALIYNWIEETPAIPEKCEELSHPVIIYGGGLYGRMRRVDGLFEAIAIYNKSNPDKKIKFMHFGFETELAIIRQLSGKYDIENFTDIRKLIPAGTFDNYCKAADILLLVIGHNTGHLEHADAIPAKLFDYFKAGKPILVIGPEGCQAGKIVEKIKRGLAVRDDNASAIANAITLLLEKRENFDLTPDAISEFKEEKVLSEFTSFLNHLGKKDSYV
jgi:glycosyltransferase involved in cell wall biosynthesis